MVDLKDLMERAEKIASQAGNSLGSDMIQELIVTLRASDDERLLYQDRVYKQNGELTSLRSENAELKENLRQEDMLKWLR